MLRFIILICCVSSVAGVQELTAADFDFVVKSYKNVLVEFYAPWCAYCKEFAPVYDTIAAHLNKTEKNLLVAKVDVEEQSDLAGRLGIDEFPTIRFFTEGNLKVKGEEFLGDLEEDDIVDFARDMVEGGGGGSGDSDEEEDEEEKEDWDKMQADIDQMNDALSQSTGKKKGNVQKGGRRMGVPQEQGIQVSTSL